MKNVRSLALAVALATSALSVACSGGTTDAQQPQTSASAMTTAPVGVSTTGRVRMVADALSAVPLRADQRSEIEKLGADAQARQANGAEAWKNVALTLADQVEKGAIDKSAIQTKIDAAVAAHQSTATDNQAALARLHDILTPEQRGAFVDAIQAKAKEMHHDHAGKHGGFAMMKQLRDDLKLTDDQVSQIKDVVMDARKDRDMKAMGKELHADMEARKDALESFRTDKFDAAALARPVDANKAAKGIEHITGIAEKVLPILTPEQRKIAADKIRERAAKGEMMPFGH